LKRKKEEFYNTYAFRTHQVPFFRSKPDKLFAAGLFTIVAVSLVLPFTPVGALFQFVHLPLTYYGLLAGIVVSYVVLVELLKLRYSSTRRGITVAFVGIPWYSLPFAIKNLV